MRASGGPWYWIYNFALHVAALCCLPFWLFVRFFKGRYRGQFRERMGILSESVTAPFGQTPALWVHAASAGESAAATPLVRALRAAFPDRPILFTVTSRYGKAMAERRLQGVADAICFSPLDLPYFCRRFLDRIQPDLYVMVETDLWPNLVRQIKQRGGRVVLASGHAGPKSFPRSFWRAVLRHVDLLLMQTETDAAHIRQRGAPAARVEVTGNLKFDGSGDPVPAGDVPALRAEFGVGDGPVLVAGSTLPEDEGPVLDAVVLARTGSVRAIVAPRRVERVVELERLCAERNLTCARRTERTATQPGVSVKEDTPIDVLILDTMGELARSYNVASVAYVGGGFTPEVGLHNLIEPLVCGVPVLFGPHRGKARKVATELVERGAGVEVADGAALPGAVWRALHDEPHRTALAAASAAVLAKHRGAAARQAVRIREFLA